MFGISHALLGIERLLVMGHITSNKSVLLVIVILRHWLLLRIMRNALELVVVGLLAILEISAVVNWMTVRVLVLGRRRVVPNIVLCSVVSVILTVCLVTIGLILNRRLIRLLIECLRHRLKYVTLRIRYISLSNIIYWLYLKQVLVLLAQMLIFCQTHFCK